MNSLLPGGCVSRDWGSREDTLKEEFWLSNRYKSDGTIGQAYTCNLAGWHLGVLSTVSTNRVLNWIPRGIAQLAFASYGPLVFSF